MRASASIAALAAAALITAQPCLAADPADTRFDLARTARAEAAQASISLAASQQTAAETEEPRRKRGIGTTPLLIAGGVVLVVLVLAAVAGATPTPGPAQGAFD